MEISLTDFLSQLVQYPALAVTTVLTLSVILVNGWTDAPNAIATCVSTRSLKPKAAILMAELENRRIYTDMLSDRQLPEKEIVDVCQLVGAKTELEKRKKDIDFLQFVTT